MLTSKEYLQRAEQCSQLANASCDAYVKEALAELASESRRWPRIWNSGTNADEEQIMGRMENATA
jgi:hypothetical protein